MGSGSGCGAEPEVENEVEPSSKSERTLRANCWKSARWCSICAGVGFSPLRHCSEAQNRSQPSSVSQRVLCCLPFAASGLMWVA